MAKLGYTFYPKDWGNSEAVFELTLTERGLYRELIDMAMLNDNKTIINLSVWIRKWNVTENELKALLGGLSHKNVIKITGENLFVQSCESRLNLVRGGSKGGSKSKPTPKPSSKPTPKPTPNQRKEKVNRKEKKEKGNIPLYQDFKTYALEKGKDIDLDKLELKYDAWVENGWKDGHDNKISNWKSKLLNTLSFLKKDKRFEAKETSTVLTHKFNLK